MTPKQRAIEALELRQPDDIIPNMEIEFQLHEELLGKSLILGDELKKLTSTERRKALQHNVEIYCEEAEKLDFSSITIDPLYWEFGHGMGTKFYYPTLEDQIEVAKLLFKEIGNKVFLAVSADGTYGIPLAQEIEKFSYDTIDNPDQLLEQAERNITLTLENTKRLIDAGVGVVYNCSDYCFNSGPFLSISMFEKFVYPFLKKQTEALKNEGAYVIKHTDGNIIPIVDLILDCKPHAIQSIDPIAGVDIKEFKQKYGDKVCIMGNVNCSKLEMGTKEEVVESAEYAINSAKPGGGYIFSSCNTIFKKIPLDNYKEMLGVRKRLGRYDVQKNV